MMLDLGEIILAQAKQRRTVHLRIAAHPIVNPGRERAAIAAIPRLFRLIPALTKTAARGNHRVPKAGCALAARRKPMSEGASPSTRADDDDVITLAGHGGVFRRRSSAGRESWEQRHSAIDEQRRADHVVGLIGG